MENREQIKNRIKELGYKKSWIAEQVGITSVWLSYYINGKKDMHKSKEVKLFDLLGIKKKK